VPGFSLSKAPEIRNGYPRSVLPKERKPGVPEITIQSVKAQVVGEKRTSEKYHGKKTRVIVWWSKKLETRDRRKRKPAPAIDCTAKRGIPRFQHSTYRREHEGSTTSRGRRFRGDYELNMFNSRLAVTKNVLPRDVAFRYAQGEKPIAFLID